MQTHKIVALENKSVPEIGRLALDVKDVVRLTGLSRAKIYQMWAAGTGPPRLKIGKRTLILSEKLLEWMDSHEVPSNGSWNR